MTAMKTWQSYSGGSGTPATTTWNYDPTLTRAWSASSLLTSETYSGGALNALNVAATYDTSRRRQTTLPRNGSTALGTTVTYNYDTAGRLLSASDGTYSATYAYLANSPSWQTLTFRQNSTVRATTTWETNPIRRQSLQIFSTPWSLPQVSKAT